MALSNLGVALVLVSGVLWLAGLGQSAEIVGFIGVGFVFIGSLIKNHKPRKTEDARPLGPPPLPPPLIHIPPSVGLDQSIPQPMADAKLGRGIVLGQPPRRLSPTKMILLVGAAALLVASGLIIRLVVVAHQGDNWNGEIATAETSMTEPSYLLFRDGAGAGTQNTKAHRVSVSFSTRAPGSVQGIVRIQDPSFLSDLGKGILSPRYQLSGGLDGDYYQSALNLLQFRLGHIGEILELDIYKGGAQNKSVGFEARAEHPFTHDVVECQFKGIEEGGRLSGDFNFTVNTVAGESASYYFEGAGSFVLSRQRESYSPISRVVLLSRENGAGGNEGTRTSPSADSDKRQLDGSDLRHPEFGVLVDPLSDGSGVKVILVVSGSFAEDIGITAKDAILSVNRRPVTSIEDLRQIEKRLRPGAPVAIHILRHQTNNQSVSLYLAGTLPQDSH